MVDPSPVPPATTGVATTVTLHGGDLPWRPVSPRLARVRHITLAAFVVPLLVAVVLLGVLVSRWALLGALVVGIGAGLLVNGWTGAGGGVAGIDGLGGGCSGGGGAIGGDTGGDTGGEAVSGLRFRIRIRGPFVAALAAAAARNTRRIPSSWVRSSSSETSSSLSLRTRRRLIGTGIDSPALRLET